MFASQANLKIANYHFRRLETEHEAVLGFVKTKVIMQGKLVSVAYTLRTFQNQFSLGGICKQE